MAVGVPVGFIYAMFCFALGYFGAAVVGLFLALLVGALVSGTLGYFAGHKWAASTLAQCAGTTPYTLLLLLGGGISLGDRLVSLIFMIGPAVIGTFVGSRIRTSRRAA
ncbi:MAG TPA: hypothetical protein VNQ32_10870 [Steroidobacteraceae bacterium]|nr:hypothetical protein [Steroidobacteraceae bacterium]